MRPKAIVQWQWVYLAVIAAGLLSTALGWNDMMATVQVQQMIARFGTAMLWVPLAIGLTIQFLFLYFIARRGSAVAKWVFVVLTALAVLWGVATLAFSGAPTAIEGVLNGAQAVLQVIAIILVFRPDARPWFGEDAIDAADVE